MKFGLRVKLVAGIMTIVLGIMGSMTVILLEKMRHEAILQRVTTVQVIAGNIENVLDLYDDIDSSLISILLKQALDLEDLIAVRYTDPNLNPIYTSHSESLKAPMIQQVNSTIRNSRLAWQVVNLQELDSKALVVTIPIRRRGEPAGGLLMLFSLKTMEQELHYFWGSTIRFISVEYAVIIIFVTLLLSMMVIRPIERMVAITHRIADGEFDHRIELATNDEIGELAQSLNIMSEKLKTSRAASEAHLISLEQAYEALQRAQQEVLRTEKLACVGHLAAGVAHEIGNPLSAVLGYLDLLQGDYPSETKADFVSRTRKEIARIEKIIRGLLDFSRPSPHTISPLNLEEILNNTLPLICTHKSFKFVKVETELPPDLLPISGDAGLLQQVFFNILLNAAQAMKGQGVLKITAQNRSAGESDRFDRVTIIIVDEGPGIPEDLLGKVMEPFYTTKPSTEGTGLGLAICQRIMEQFQGSMELANRSDRSGLVVTLTFRTFDPIPKEQR